MVFPVVFMNFFIFCFFDLSSVFCKIWVSCWFRHDGARVFSSGHLVQDLSGAFGEATIHGMFPTPLPAPDICPKNWIEAAIFQCVYTGRYGSFQHFPNSIYGSRMYFQYTGSTSHGLDKLVLSMAAGLMQKFFLFAPARVTLSTVGANKSSNFGIRTACRNLLQSIASGDFGQSFHRRFSKIGSICISLDFGYDGKKTW